MNADRVAAEKPMNELLPFARKMLSQFGEFHPFGGYMLDDESVVHVGLESGAEGAGSGRVRATQLEERLREISLVMRPLVVGLVKNVSLGAPVNGVRDAVEFALEHRAGYCAEVFFPYRALDSGQGVEFLDATAQAGKRGRFLGSAEIKS